MRPPPNLKLAFRDIKNGFSEIEIAGNLFYLKHISFEDQVNFDQVHEKYLKEAEKRGVPCEKDCLERLFEEKQWSSKQERLIASEKSFIETLTVQKKNLFLKSEIDRVNVDIEEGNKRLNKLKQEKAALLSRTAESYAEERVNDYYILKCLYKTRDLKSGAYTEDEFDEIDSDTLMSIIKAYNEVYHNINEESIKKIVLQDFFSYYSPFAENPVEFYGKSVCDLTYNQLKLLIYARFFKNAFQNNESMPEDIKNDPDKIIDYINAGENFKKVKERGGEKDGAAQSYPGATKEDLEYMGVIKKGQKPLSLAEEAKKKGGSLDLNDMFKLLGGGN